MKVSENLFDVIHSLSKSEKRYIKLFHLENTLRATNLNRLFDAVEKQKKYDHEKLIALFKDDRFSKRLNVTKQNLYNLILKALRAYNSELSVLTRINNHVQNIENLYAKGLFDLATIELIKAKQLANEHQTHFNYTQVLYWQRLLYSKLDLTGKLNLPGKEFNDEYFAAQKITLNSLEYWNLKNSLINLENLRQKKGQRSKLEKLTASPLFTTDMSLSGDARYNYFQAKLFYFIIKEDTEHVKLYFNKLINHIETDQFFIANREKEIWITIENYLLFLVRHQKNSEFLLEANRFKNVKTVDPAAKMQQWICCTCLTFAVYYRNKEFDNAHDLIPSINKQYAVYTKQKITTTTRYNIHTTLLMIAGSYIQKREYSQCIKHINSLILDKTMGLDKENKQFFMILLSIAHYEKSNYKISKDILNKIETVEIEKYKSLLLMMKFIKESMTTKDQRQKAIILNLTLIKLKILQKIKTEQEIKSGFDFEYYLQQKAN